MKSGDHLVTPRISYEHHGLYIGNDRVIDYTPDGVCIRSLDSFSDGHDIHVEDHPFRFYSHSESVSRGKSRLGDDNYNVIFNNCEHFVNWCINGLHISDQVNRVLAAIIKAMEESWKRQKPIYICTDLMRTIANAGSLGQNQPITASVLKTLLGQGTIGSELASRMGTGVVSSRTNTGIATGIASRLATSCFASRTGTGVAYGVKRLFDWFND